MNARFPSSRDERARRTRRSQHRRRQAARPLAFESLEQRQLLAATDLASITGRVYRDANGDGFSAGEQVSGATLNLFRDNGNGILDAADGASLSSATTDGNGTYRFSQLGAGDYFVQQPAQIVGSANLLQSTSDRIRITAGDAQGTPGVTIDGFSTAQRVEASLPLNTPVNSVVAAAEAVGGERDLSVTMTSGATSDRVTVEVASGGGVLNTSATVGAAGRFNLTWDGADGNAATLNPTGLGGVDLTNGGASTYLLVSAEVDRAGGQATLRVYTNASNFSQATIPLTGTTPQNYLLAFGSDFTVAGGSGANFANVGAITLETSGTTVAQDGQISALRTVAPTVFTADFSNVQSADLELAKTSANPTFNPGQSVSFTLNVVNKGPSPATNVVVTDKLPTGLSFVSYTTQQGSYNASNGAWTIGTIDVGATAVLQMTATGSGQSPIINTAQITQSDQDDPDSTPNNNNASEDDQSSLTLSPQLADLSLSKTANNTAPNVGQSLTFTINLTNAGPSTATNVNVLDKLPAGLTFTNATPSQGTYNASSGVWNVGSIAAQTSAILQITATLTTASPVVNTAQVTSSDQRDPDSTPNNNVTGEDDQASIALTAQQADLSLTKTVDNTTPNVNSTITYTLNLANLGPGAATNVVVTDLLPSSLTFVNASASQGSYDAGTGRWTAGTVGVGAPASLQLTARVRSSGSVINTAQVTHSDQPDPNSTPNNNVGSEDDQASITLNGQQSDLSLDNTVSVATPQVGANITFTVTVRNAGPSAATGVVVRDTLPVGFALVSSTPSTGTVDNANGQWSIPSLAAGGNATWQITGTVTGPQPLVNTAEIVAADQFDPDSTPNNQNTSEDDQKSVTATPQTADLSLTKTVSQERPNVGQPVTFTVTVNNAGPNAASGVTVRDVLPEGLALSSSTASQGSYDPGQGTWTVGNVANNGKATLTLVTNVVSNPPKTNTAEITASSTYDPDSVPNNQNGTEDDQASATVTPLTADLSLTKTVDKPTPNVGDAVTFTITLHNDGPDPATGVIVRDLLPAGLSYQSSNASQGTYNPTSGNWTLDPVSARSDVTLRLVATATVPGAKSNDAEVIDSDQFDPDSTPNNNNPAEDDQASATAVPQTADLALQKFVDFPTPNVGDTITFTVAIGNAGPNTATGVVVRDLLPAGLTFLSAAPSQGTYKKASGEWTVGDIETGGNLTLRLSGTVDSLGAKTNTAEVLLVNQFDPDSTPGNGKAGEDDLASATVTPQAADLALTAAISAQAPNVGDRVTVTFTLANAGPDTATGVAVQAALPAGMTFISGTPSAGTYDAGTDRWTVETLEAEAGATLAIVLAVDTIGEKTVSAEIVAAEQADPDSVVNNDAVAEDDQASVALTPQTVDLSLVKTDAPDPVFSGSELTFTLTVTNAGPWPATDVVLTDTLPNGRQGLHVQFVSATPSQGTASAADGVVTVQLGTINPAGSATVTIVVTVEEDYEGLLANQAEVRAAQFDIQLDNNTSITTTGATPPPSQIVGTVFLDLITVNGKQDDQEPGVAQVEMVLYSGWREEATAAEITDAPLRTDWTSPDGVFQFDQLKAGRYTLYEKQPRFLNDGLEGFRDDTLGRPVANDKFFFQLGSGEIADGYTLAETLFVKTPDQPGTPPPPLRLSLKEYFASAFRP